MATISSSYLPRMLDATATQNNSSSDTTTNTSLQDVGQSQFLKLLVAQLQNQDPLSPMQNEEFVTQLATFSSLDQLISINKAVTSLADGTNGTSTGGKDAQKPNSI